MIVSPKLGLTLAAFAALGLAAAHPAAAAVTVYNFQAGAPTGNGPTYVGTGALGQGGTTFNRVTYTGSGSLNQIGGGTGGTVLDSNSNPAPNAVFTYQAENYQYAPDTSGTATAASVLLGSIASTPKTGGGVDDISFTGLTPNAPFTAIFYGENGHYADGRVTTYQMTNSTFATPIGAPQNTVANNADAFTTGPGNYVTFSGQTDASGGIYATYMNNGTNGFNEGDFNGAQFAVGTPAVPEASSSIGLGVLLALGGLALVARKKSIKA